MLHLRPWNYQSSSNIGELLAQKILSTTSYGSKVLSVRSSVATRRTCEKKSLDL